MKKKTVSSLDLVLAGLFAALAVLIATPMFSAILEF